MQKYLNPFACLEELAIQRPNAVALADAAETVTNRQLYLQVSQLSEFLYKKGVRNGQLVIVALGTMLDFKVTLALMKLGSASGSSAGNARTQFASSADWVIIDQPVAEIPREKAILLDKAALVEASKIDRFMPLDDFKDEESLMRIIFTSGTTGKIKAAFHSVADFQRRLWGQPEKLQHPGQPISLMGNASAGGFFTNIRSLAEGYPVLLRRGNEGQKSMVEVARRYQPTNMFASPNQLAGFMAAMQGNKQGLEKLDFIRVGGGACNQKLVDQARSLLGVDLTLSCGSTEGGNIASRKASESSDFTDVGALNDDVTLEIVNTEGLSLPVGQEGVVRYKTPQMLKSYVNNPEETAKSFKEGWFYPGDLGFIDPRGHLHIIGRANDQVNIGGVKIDPATIDAWAIKQPGVEDAAAFVMAEKNGRKTLSLAVISKAGFDLGAFKELCIAELKAVSPQKFILVESIPKNEMGKSLRGELAKRYSGK